MPGIKKLEKGEFCKIDKGNPPNNFPDGEIIKAPPPPMAEIPRNARRQR